MTRRPRRTWPYAAGWSLVGMVFAANAAAVDVHAWQLRTTPAIVAGTALSYLAVLLLGQALVYSGSVAVNAGRSAYRRRDYKPTGRTQYTPEQLVEHREYAQADTLAYARQAAAWAAGAAPGVTRRHAAPAAPRRIDDTVPMPAVDETAECVA